MEAARRIAFDLLLPIALQRAAAVRKGMRVGRSSQLGGKPGLGEGGGGHQVHQGKQQVQQEREQRRVHEQRMGGQQGGPGSQQGWLQKQQQRDEQHHEEEEGAEGQTEEVKGVQGEPADVSTTEGSREGAQSMKRARREPSEAHSTQLPDTAGAAAPQLPSQLPPPFQQQHQSSCDTATTPPTPGPPPASPHAASSQLPMLQQAVTDCNKPPLPGDGDMFEDTAALVRDTGFAIVFASAFPLGPVVCLLLTALRIRLDALKLLEGCRRPLPRRAAAGIGRSWRAVICCQVGM